jgi:hypothetical protein
MSLPFLHPTTFRIDDVRSSARTPPALGRTYGGASRDEDPEASGFSAGSLLPINIAAAALSCAGRSICSSARDHGRARPRTLVGPAFPPPSPSQSLPIAASILSALSFRHLLLLILP